ncbi:hypothetical protein BH09MYX1_BH09MYX1_18680 [soil metagenome]
MNRLAKLARYVVDFNHHRRFADHMGAYRGVFRTMAEARASAPDAKIGFDFDESASLYDERIGKLFPSDYPAMFWLRECLRTARTVFDFGGHVGVSFYAYEKPLALDGDVRWTVCDMPKITSRGRVLAAVNGATNLSFCERFSECERYEVLLCSGSLHYLEPSLAELLAPLAKRPHHLVLNKLPLTSGSPFVTLQNTVHSFNPYKVQNREALLRGLTNLGYDVVDAWENADMACHIPLHRDRTVARYSGFYLRARA